MAIHLYLAVEEKKFWNLGNTPFAREAAYVDFVRIGLSGKDEKMLTRSTQRSGALGDDSFLTELEKNTKKSIKPGLKGRPIKLNSNNQ